MLVLTRQFNQSIQIGDNIKITVVKLYDDKVRLGISCPREIPIVRSELEPHATQNPKHIDSPTGLPANPSGGEAAGGESVGVGPAVG